jgi:hypothetical protein
MRNRFSSLIGKIRRRLADDFDAPDHGVLFLLVGAEIRFRRVFDVGGNEPSRQPGAKFPGMIGRTLKTNRLKMGKTESKNNEEWLRPSTPDTRPSFYGVYLWISQL